jgi:type IV secretion system protein VirD4
MHGAGTGRTTHGSAAWASAHDIRQAGLLRKRPGVICGQKWGKRLIESGDGHALVIGPTGSRKDRSHLWPMTVAWPGSMVILDVKDHAENLRHCGRARARRGPVVVFAPTMSESHSINLLSHIRWGTPDEFRDADQLARSFVAPRHRAMQRSQGPQFFEDWGVLLLRSLVLHVGRYLPHKSLAGVLAFMQDRKACMQALIRSAHPAVAAVGRAIQGLAADTRTGFWTTVFRLLDLWNDPRIVQHTERTDIRFTDLQYGSRPVTLYLAANHTDELAYLYPLFRAVMEQTLSVLKSQADTPKWSLLCNFNEFNSFGYAPFFEEQIATVRSRGMRFVLALQDVDQLLTTWGERNAIWGNCGTKIIHRPFNDTFAARLVQMLGAATVPAVSESRQGRFGGRTVSTHPVRRPLLDVSEVLGLGAEDVLVQVPGCARWIRCQKLPAQKLPAAA